MRLRRCAILFVEPRERLDFDLALLFQGETGLRVAIDWIALAPHLDGAVPLDAAEVVLLGRVGETEWLERDALVAAHGGAVDTLLAKGLLVADDGAHAAVRARDDTLRAAHWYGLSAAAHYFSRWDGETTAAHARGAEFANVREMVEKRGPPPPHVVERCAADARVALPRPATSAFDALLGARTTCRNFAGALDAARASAVLHRVFGAQAAVELAPGATALKKHSPSGGGLHPIEAYVVAQRVDGVAPGLYHYHPLAHALEPLRALEPVALRGLAATFVADQAYFADAPILVALVARFARNFWKYRNHAKAYRAVVLDAGHLSQTLYLSATELGLGAFVTAAINEVDVERAFGLDARVESPLAICGFGPRAAQRVTVELDPLGVGVGVGGA